jgi:hypothetical protein
MNRLRTKKTDYVGVSGKIHPDLSDKMEAICDSLQISKTSFIELAVERLCESKRFNKIVNDLNK